jgi:hypothetical protein
LKSEGFLSLLANPFSKRLKAETPLHNINNRFKSSRSKLTRNLTIRDLMRRLASKPFSRERSPNRKLRLMLPGAAMAKESAIGLITNLFHPVLGIQDQP